MLIDMKKIITISATVGMSYCFEQMLNTIWLQWNVRKVKMTVGRLLILFGVRKI
jgi:hypothetical protein